MFARSHPFIRPVLLGLFVAVLVASLVASNSVRFGHADVPAPFSAAEIQPLQVGDQAPRFTVETVDNEQFDFDPRYLERPVLLISFRGGWCPYCNLHLSELRSVMPEISDMDIDVLFLSGDRSELLYSSLQQETRENIAGLGYTILSDANVQAAVALGIAFKASERTIKRRHDKGQDIEGSSMARHGLLPVPAVFAINRAGTIEYAYTNPDYKTRLSADELVAVAQEMTALK